MKKVLIGIIAGLLIGGAATWSVVRHAPGQQEAEEKKTEEPKEESRVQHSTNGETVIKLDKAAQERAGIKVVAPESVQLPPEIKGYGHVLDPSPFAQLLTEGATAKAAFEASTKDFQRIKTLYDQNQNVSTRALETAEATMQRDEVQLLSVKTRLILALGKSAEELDLPSFVKDLAALRTTLVRIDLPLGQALETPPLGGRLATLVAEDKQIDAQYLGPAPSADPQTQGQGFLFLIKSNAPPPGSAMIGWLKIPGETEKGFVIPRAAVVRHEGEAFVYVQSGDTTFERKEIEMEHPFNGGWFIKSGVDVDEKLVLVGAQLLLSEELKSQAGDEE